MSKVVIKLSYFALLVDLLNRKIDNGDFIPEHKWEDTTLSFKNPDGEWNDGVNLKGEAGSIKNATAKDITTSDGSDVQSAIDNVSNIVKNLTANDITTSNGSNVQSAIDILEQKTTIEYSTEEQLTGDYWINGKPIYMCTITVGSLGNGGSTLINLSSLNIEICMFDTGNSAVLMSEGVYVPIQQSTTTNSNTGTFLTEVRYLPNSNSLSFACGASRGLTSANITIRYTKR